jgi:hypothetical protein
MSTDTARLRASVTGLLGWTAVEEELLLAGLLLAGLPSAGLRPAGDGPGSPDCWAAVPVIAHNTEFKRQQVIRLTAIRQGGTPPDFAEIDHRSAAVYRAYCQPDAGQVRQDSREVTAALIDGLAAVGDADLLDPSRHRWLRGRMLWLQLVVRGFWHPMGHLADYYICHGQAARAAQVQAQAVAVAGYLGAPDPARGMAHYSLACAQARADQTDAALAELATAVRLNADLAAKLAGEPDLAGLRSGGRLDALAAS